MVLFVCTGNTCRSPMAQAIYQHLTGKEAKSAGLAAHANSLITPNAEQTLEEMGITDFVHRAQPLTPELLEEAEKVYVMEEQHRRIILAVYPAMASRIQLLNEEGILDPFAHSIKEYRLCAKLIRNAILRQEGLDDPQSNA